MEARDSVWQEVYNANAEFQASDLKVQARRKAITLPSVSNLHARAESFLEAAKLAISMTASLVGPFYHVKLDHRYHQLANWAEKEFGSTDELAVVVRHWEPWVKTVVDMRNAVDHPKDKLGGKLITQNFTLTQKGTYLILMEPTWGLSGQPQQLLVADMDAIIEGIIMLGEDILVCLFNKLKSPFPLVVNEIPPDKRDPACPIRLQVGLTSGSGHEGPS